VSISNSVFECGEDHADGGSGYAEEESDDEACEGVCVDCGDDEEGDGGGDCASGDGTEQCFVLFGFGRHETTACSVTGFSGEGGDTGLFHIAGSWPEALPEARAEAGQEDDCGGGDEVGDRPPEEDGGPEGDGDVDPGVGPVHRPVRQEADEQPDREVNDQFSDISHGRFLLVRLFSSHEGIGRIGEKIKYNRRRKT
jgi:hypothetical protein